MPLKLRYLTSFQIQKLRKGLFFRDGRDLIVFGNIKGLYDFHSRIFTKGLRNSNKDPAKILELFMKRKSDLMLRYGRYSINKPRSELIVGTFQQEYFTKMETHLQQEMRLADHLIKPVQHFMRSSGSKITYIKKKFIENEQYKTN